MGIFNNKTDRALRKAIHDSNARMVSKMVQCSKCGTRQQVVGNANNAYESVTCRKCGKKIYFN